MAQSWGLYAFFNIDGIVLLQLEALGADPLFGHKVLFADRVSGVASAEVGFDLLLLADIGDEDASFLVIRCREINPSLPEKAYGLEYLAFREKNPYYMFDYLSNEEIVDAIKHEIIWNKSLAGHVARMFYNTNSVGTMESYIELISTYERVFKGDIYKPDIFYETLNLI